MAQNLDVAVVLRLRDALTGPLRAAQAALAEFQRTAEGLSRSFRLDPAISLMRNLGNAAKEAAAAMRTASAASGQLATAAERSARASSSVATGARTASQAARDLGSAINSIRASAIDAATNQIRGLSSALRTAARAADAAATAFARVTTPGVGAATAQVNALANAWTRVSGAMRSAQAPAGPQQPGAAPSGGPYVGGAWGPRGFYSAPQPVPGGGWFQNTPGFRPNASIPDRVQFRAVNAVESRVVDGALGIDKARTRLGLLNLSPEIRAQAERFAAEQTKTYKELTRADILDVVGEIVTQFQNPADAFQLAPDLLQVVRAQMLTGSSAAEAKQGMAQLVRAIGLSGRLTDASGRFTPDESRALLDAYTRAKIIGGQDITPSQAFQAVKYMKSLGQTISSDALLKAFIAMPDLRASTYGNQLYQFTNQLTGRATKHAMAAQEAAGLIQRNRDGSYGGTVDSQMLFENPTAWVEQHITGPDGFLRRRGLDPMTSSPAAIRDALKPLFSNASAENMANMIVNQLAEWRNQVQNAKALNLTPENLAKLSAASLHSQLQSVGSQLVTVIGDIVEKLKGIVLPVTSGTAATLQGTANTVDDGTNSTTSNVVGGVVTAGVVSAAAVVGALGVRAALAAAPRFGLPAIALGGLGGFGLTGEPFGAAVGALGATALLARGALARLSPALAPWQARAARAAVAAPTTGAGVPGSAALAAAQAANAGAVATTGWRRWLPSASGVAKGGALVGAGLGLDWLAGGGAPGWLSQMLLLPAMWNPIGASLLVGSLALTDAVNGFENSKAVAGWLGTGARALTGDRAASEAWWSANRDWWAGVQARLASLVGVTPAAAAPVGQPVPRAATAAATPTVPAVPRIGPTDVAREPFGDMLARAHLVTDGVVTTLSDVTASIPRIAVSVIRQLADDIRALNAALGDLPRLVIPPSAVAVGDPTALPTLEPRRGGTPAIGSEAARGPGALFTGPISVTVTAQTNASPDAIGASVAAALANYHSGALHDGAAGIP